MNLIANSGIQFYNTSLEIDQDEKFKMFFHEWFDPDEGIVLEIAHKFNDEDVWVKKIDLFELGYLTEDKILPWEEIKDDFLSNGKKTIINSNEDAEEAGCFQEVLNRINWEKFENVWLPIPFFKLKGKNTSFGPTNWARFKLIPVDTTEKARKYQLLLAFDTRSVSADEDYEDDDLDESPVFIESFKKSMDFALCTREFDLIDFCSSQKGCAWVDGYILKTFHGSMNFDIKTKPKRRYLAQYLCVLNYLRHRNILPTVTLMNDEGSAKGSVDLVVDIGNSRTCAVLYDDGDFTKVSPLELQDFSTPILDGELNIHKDSFDMRLAFRKAEFGGNMGIANSIQFNYPSLVRLGKEARSLIQKSTNLNSGAEKTSTFSSAKRYLWDDQLQRQEWEFVTLKDEPEEEFYIPGISNQLNKDGSLNLRGDGGTLMQYSRRALMTLSFLEILAQARRQINSHAQRHHWGNVSRPREIRKIIVTCPTAMSREEQAALRKCAEDAAIMLNRYYGNFPKEVDEQSTRKHIEVIPDASKLRRTEDKSEWIYDEATAAHFVYLYSEIGKRYLNNAKDFFGLYGKIRTDLQDYNEKSVTIGSVDIGAGTTDVMIAAYKNVESNRVNLTPIPLFWESFGLAGDDLLKQIVHQLVVEGDYSPIQQKLDSSDLSKSEIAVLYTDFFGENTGMSFKNRQLRRDFNLQVSAVIGSYFLELLRNKSADINLSFEDIFKNNYPADAVLQHFKEHFGFGIEEITWNYRQHIVASIVEKTFDTMVGKISALFSKYECDIVLLSGRPSSLKPLTDLFLKYYAVAPNRLKTMHNYRVGHWYPQDKRHKFIDGEGYFINPKSVVTTGAMIGYLASKGNLNGFLFNLGELAEKLEPTTEYFGILNTNIMDFSHTIISPEKNYIDIEIASLPIHIGSKQIDTHAYPGKSFYFLDFNEWEIEDKVRGRMDYEDAENVNLVNRAMEREMDNLRSKLPFTFRIEREYMEDKELLKIESVTSASGDDLRKSFFHLQVQSMEEEDFWLDNGIFKLNLNYSDNR